jgi:hypothetical protein
MIKLKSMLNITEQAPQPMPGMGGAPQPMQAPAPAAPMDQPVPEEPTTPEPEVDATPTPDDPGEYDWTKDFRAFEDAKNKAEAQAKKKLLDKMNKQLVNKKVTVNASRGYGQPKTDHMIEKVKKLSVEFWYKEWVVIMQDENDKKYFLTPGVNIKIEGGQDGAGGPEDQSPEEPGAAATGATGEEQPNAEAPTSAGTPGAPDAMGGIGTAMGTQPDASMTMPGAGAPPPDPNALPTTGTTPPPVPGQQPPTQPGTVPPPEEFPQKKKKLAEKASGIQTIGKDLRFFLLEFMSDSIKDSRGNVNFEPYIKGIKSAINEGRNASVYKARIEIPVNHMKQPLDTRDVKLAVKESMWSSGNVDSKFNRGSLEISQVGKIYIMDYTKQTAWKF